MIEVVYTYKRPNINIDFVNKSANMIDLITMHYGDKLLYSETTLSDDLLTLTRSAIWTSLEDFQTFQNDERFKDHREQSMNYHKNNKIVVRYEIKEIEV